jgi:hypothetical protein
MLTLLIGVEWPILTTAINIDILKEFKEASSTSTKDQRSKISQPHTY